MATDAITGLEPGQYHVGREDGTVDVMPVVIYPTCADGNPECKLCLDCFPEHDDLIEHALANPGWWWRRVAVPNALPDSFQGEPMPSGMPD